MADLIAEIQALEAKAASAIAAAADTEALQNVTQEFTGKKGALTHVMKQLGSLTPEQRGEMIRGVPEDDQERSREDGKASSVQFVRFPFTPAQVEAFRSGTGDVVVGFDHANYGHMAVMSAPVRQALSADFA